MSAFALPIPPRALASPLHRPTERSATTPEVRDQRSEIRTAAIEGSKHPGNFPIRAPPALGHICIDITKVTAIKRPYLHLVGRTQRHRHKPAKRRLRHGLSAKPFRKIGTDRFRCPADLVRQGKLLDPRQVEAYPMHLQRQPIGPLKHLELFKPSNPLAPLISVFHLFS